MAIEVLMPALSPTMKKGNLAKWHKKEGDKVSPGDMIAEIETDKATMEVESVDSGSIGKIVVSEGSKNVLVNSLIAVIAEDGDGAKEIQAVIESHSKGSDTDKKEQEKEEKPQDKKEDSSRTEASNIPIERSENDRVFASPLARSIAAKREIDIVKITGSGPNGRIIKRDVESISDSQEDIRELVANRHYKETPVSPMRSVIAKRLTDAKRDIPHFYLNGECVMDHFLNFRERINSSAKISKDAIASYRISVNDFIIKAAACALESVPEANVSWNGNTIIQYESIDISVAVALEDGLITPIVKDANNMSLTNISSTMKDLVKRAKEQELSQEEYQGGSFTISNLGMYNIHSFNAIINPPQSCILAVGATSERPIVMEGKLVAGKVMNITLSCDHRVIDGAVGAQLLNAIKGYIEKPELMLL